MIELRYNADGELEYRTAITVGQYRGLYANFDAGELQWNEWKIVPSEPVDNNLRTERVVLEVRHCDGSSASKWLWHDAMAEYFPTKAWQIKSVRVVDETDEARRQSAAWDGARQAYSDGLARLTAERDDWIAAFKILAKNMPGIDIDLNDPIGTATKIDEAIRQKMTNMSTLIESYARDNRPCNWSHQEMYRLGFGDINSGINADCFAVLSEKYEQVKKELDEIKVLTDEEQKAVEYAHGLIKYYAKIADGRYDHKTYYHDHRDALAGLLARHKLVAGGEGER